jgi:hypothetical protein
MRKNISTLIAFLLTSFSINAQTTVPVLTDVQKGHVHTMYVRPDGRIGCTDDETEVMEALRSYDPNRPLAVNPTKVVDNQPLALLSPAASTFAVTYTGFTSQAQIAFQYAVDIWAGLITSPQTIRVSANFSALAAGVLGSAGPNLLRGLTIGPNTSFYPDALADKLGNTDYGVGLPDINASFSSSYSFYFGTDGICPSGKVDFVSVVLHELGHGLGFIGSGRSGAASSTAPCTGTTGQGCWGYVSSAVTYPIIYDRSVKNGSNDATAVSIMTGATYANPSTSMHTLLTGGSLYFNGANVRAANGGLGAKLYAPSTYAAGSTYSHFDETTFPAGNSNSLMTYAIASQEVIQSPGRLGCALMLDIGWTLAGSCLTVLPIELTSLKALNKGNYNEINWETATERNNHHFVIERSPDAKNFEAIGTVKGAGTTNTPQYYSLMDKTPFEGITYYRMRQIDNDGAELVSKVVSVLKSAKDKNVARFYPNPTHNILTVEHTPSVKTFEIVNTLGQIIKLVNPTLEATQTDIPTADLSNGVYFLRVNQTEMVRFVKF